MKRLPILIGVVTCALLAGAPAYAQLPSSLPGGSRFNPPPRLPPPPPKIEAPVVPKLDAPLSYDYLPPPRPSFSDRIARCLDEGAASGLRPSARAAYSRSCANGG
jgi:hypothetical protein